MSKITGKAPFLRYLSKWIIVGGTVMAALGIIINVFAYYAVIFDFGCYWSGPDGPPCTDEELQEQHMKDFLQAISSPLFYIGLASAIIAFIAWANVRHW